MINENSHNEKENMTVKIEAIVIILGFIWCLRQLMNVNCVRITGVEECILDTILKQSL